MDVAVEQVVADVGGRSLHALDVDFSFGHIKVVVEELTRVLGLPEEVLSNVAPELCGTGSESDQRETHQFAHELYDYYNNNKQ